MLTGVWGSPQEVDEALLWYALKHPPALLLDCANRANPHSFFPFFPDEEAFANVHVVQIEVIYKFRDSLKEAKRWAGELETKEIIITTFARLFDYGDDDENKDIFEHSWELMCSLAESHDIKVGLDKRKPLHRKLADRYCKNQISVSDFVKAMQCLAQDNPNPPLSASTHPNPAAAGGRRAGGRPL